MHLLLIVFDCFNCSKARALASTWLRGSFNCVVDDAVTDTGHGAALSVRLPAGPPPKASFFPLKVDLPKHGPPPIGEHGKVLAIVPFATANGQHLQGVQHQWLANSAAAPMQG